MGENTHTNIFFVAFLILLTVRNLLLEIFREFLLCQEHKIFNDETQRTYGQVFLDMKKLDKVSLNEVFFF
jgi:hypothetical protein